MLRYQRSLVIPHPYGRCEVTTGQAPGTVADLFFHKGIIPAQSNHGCAGTRHTRFTLHGPSPAQNASRRSHSSLQLLKRYRQVANPLAGGVKDGIGDCRRNADNADFADTLAPEHRGVEVGDAN